MRELFLEIWASMRRNRLRTFLTGFSVAWGIFMLVILLGSGNGLKNGFFSHFDRYTVNSMEIYGGYTSKPYGGYEKGRDIRLRNSDLTILEHEFPEVDQVTATARFDSRTASVDGRFMKTSLQGCLPELTEIRTIKLSAGRFINRLDVDRYRRVIVIDEAMRRVLFAGADPLGRRIRVGDSTAMALFTVVGVEEGDAERSTSSCYIPLTTGQLIYTGNDPEVSSAVFTVNGIDTDDEMQEFERRLIHRIAAEHDFDPEDESAVWLRNNMAFYKEMSLVFGGIDLFIWIIGLGTLLAGVVGVSNIMLVTVAERTFEFGIRKALGARPSSIIRLILIESIAVTALFGYMGMVLGVAVMEGVNRLLERMPADDSQFGGTIFVDPTLDLSIAVSATLVLVAAGLVAGYVPARRAARLKTIDALRHNK